MLKGVRFKASSFSGLKGLGFDGCRFLRFCRVRPKDSGFGFKGSRFRGFEFIDLQ